jgi:putative ABC transport system permease protein
VLGGDGAARMVSSGWVEPGFFRMLGTPPVQGREFTVEDLPPPGSPSLTIVLSHAGWHRYLDGESGVIGREIVINGVPRTVIGVLPRDFISPVGEADFFFALNLAPVIADPISARRSHWLGLIGRLDDGISQDAARHELALIGDELARRYPEDYSMIRMNPVKLRTAMVGETRTPLLILLASAALVLLIACANLAGALLSRILARRKEFAVRAALGAGRGRLACQLLAESTILALAGGAAGILLGVFALKLMRDLASTALPHFASVALDGGAVAVGLGLALLTGLIIGALPAIVIGGSDPQKGLADQSRGGSESGGSRRLRGVLVAGQVALCLSLVVSAGLLTRSLWNMANAPAGFDPEGVLTASVQVSGPNYQAPEAQLRYHQELARRMQAIPEVTEVTTATFLPQNVFNSNSFEIEGRPWVIEGSDPFVLWTGIADNYFSTLRIPLLQGRAFDSRDHAEAPPVIIISETMARRWWPDGDAVGARIRIGPDREAPMHEIIGIVGDVRNDPARADAEPITYASIRQSPFGAAHVLLRSRGDQGALIRRIEQEIVAIDPNLPVRRVAPLTAVMSDGLADRRLPVMLMMAFGGLALLLASVGVYAMFANMAAARERELGIRVALGATRATIARLVVGQGAAWMSAGIGLGLLLTAVIGLWLRELLFGVSPFDLATLGIAALALAGAVAVALVVPVRRATSVDPIQVLRSE